MKGIPKVSVKTLLLIGLAAVIPPQPAAAAPGDGALSGPAAAIAKARAAAATAGQHAAKTDAESEAALGPARTAEHADSKVDTPPPAVPGDSGSAEAPPGQAEATASANDKGEQRSSYDVSAHRDPFRPPRLSTTADARTPLETYQLGQLKLVGVVAQVSEGYRAMVEDSAGLGYIITIGTPIGSSGGVVRSIEPRRVVIEESTRDFYGDLKPKEVVMELPQEDRSP